MGLWEVFSQMGQAFGKAMRQVPLGSVVKEIPQTLGAIASKAIPQLLQGNYFGAVMDSVNVVRDKYGDQLENEAKLLIKRAGQNINNVVMDEIRKKRHYEI